MNQTVFKDVEDVVVALQVMETDCLSCRTAIAERYIDWNGHGTMKTRS
jgi:hypothetical protein